MSISNLDEYINVNLKQNPILTIGIPTFNRAGYLDRCLKWIYDEIGNDENIEILVCDNASTDNTELIVSKYMAQYSNLVYFKQEKNEGFSKNLKTVLDLATGDFINPHGDDDYFNHGIIYNFIEIIKQNKDVSLMYASRMGQQLQVLRGTGFDDYLNNLNTVNFITTMLVNKNDYKNIENKNLYIETAINQVYFQLEILKNNQRFCIIHGEVLNVESGYAPRIGYNFAQVAIAEYFDIICSFEKYGLQKQTIQNEKLRVLNTIIIPAMQQIISGAILLETDNTLDIFKKYYCNEPYYFDALKEVTRLTEFL